MRNPTAIATHGTGKSRSKPLHKRPIKNLIAQQRGYQRLMNTYDRVIKRTAKPVTVRMSKMRSAVQRGINQMKFAPKKPAPFKINIGKK